MHLLNVFFSDHFTKIRNVSEGRDKTYNCLHFTLIIKKKNLDLTLTDIKLEEMIVVLCYQKELYCSSMIECIKACQ